jgi:hypothetical protein
MKSLLNRHYFAFLSLLGGVAMTCSFLLGIREGSMDQGEPVSLVCTDTVLQMLSMPVSDLADGIVPAPQTKGKYVGSKNGTKYYTPGCSGAKRIKPENYIWFLTEDDAKLQGYTPAQC